MVDESHRPPPPDPPASRARPGVPARPEARELFRKRAGGIGTAPLFFSVALGVTFGLSLGLLLNQPILGVVFGAMLGLLYGLVTGKGPRP